MNRIPHFGKDKLITNEQKIHFVNRIMYSTFGQNEFNVFQSRYIHICIFRITIWSPYFMKIIQMCTDGNWKFSSHNYSTSVVRSFQFRLSDHKVCFFRLFWFISLWLMFDILLTVTAAYLFITNSVCFSLQFGSFISRLISDHVSVVQYACLCAHLCGG